MLEKIQQYYFLSLLCLAMQVDVCAITAYKRVIATINTGVTPAGIALTPDNRFAYVANNNNYGIPGGDSVSVLNLKTNMPQQIISIGVFNSQPYTVTMNAEGTLAYVTNSNITTISIIDIETNTVTGTIGGFNGPSGMVITPSGTTAYVNNYGAGADSGFGNTVSVVDLNTNTIVGTIIVGQAPAAVAVTPNGQFVYVLNYVDGNTGTGTISIIQTSNNTVVGTIRGFSGPFGIAITPDGNYAYVTNFGSNNFTPIGTTVSVIDLSSNTMITTINLGIQPAGIAITPDGLYAYVTNYNSLYDGTEETAGQGTVNIIDIATNTLVPVTIPVDQSPANVAISSNGYYAYVTNYTSNTVSVLNILEGMWLK